MLFLGSFLNDWWDSISKFFKGLNTTITSLLIALLAIMCLFCIIRFLKPTFSADKGKFRIMPLVFAILFQRSHVSTHSISDLKL